MSNNIWYFTFGLDHPFKDRIQPIRGSFDSARKMMFEIYGEKWCWQYNHDEFVDLVEKYHYDFLLPEVDAKEVCQDERC